MSKVFCVTNWRNTLLSLFYSGTFPSDFSERNVVTFDEDTDVFYYRSCIFFKSDLVSLGLPSYPEIRTSNIQAITVLKTKFLNPNNKLTYFVAEPGIHIRLWYHPVSGNCWHLSTNHHIDAEFSREIGCDCRSVFFSLLVKKGITSKRQLYASLDKALQYHFVLNENNVFLVSVTLMNDYYYNASPPVTCLPLSVLDVGCLNSVKVDVSSETVEKFQEKLDTLESTKMIVLLHPQTNIGVKITPK